MTYSPCKQVVQEVITEQSDEDEDSKEGTCEQLGLSKALINIKKENEHQKSSQL